MFELEDMRRQILVLPSFLQLCVGRDRNDLPFDSLKPEINSMCWDQISVDPRHEWSFAAFKKRNCKELLKKIAGDVPTDSMTTSNFIPDACRKFPPRSHSVSLEIGFCLYKQVGRWLASFGDPMAAEVVVRWTQRDSHFLSRLRRKKLTRLIQMSRPRMNLLLPTTL